VDCRGNRVDILEVLSLLFKLFKCSNIVQWTIVTLASALVAKHPIIHAFFSEAQIHQLLSGMAVAGVPSVQHPQQ
jgi:hypothetical protein